MMVTCFAGHQMSGKPEAKPETFRASQFSSLFTRISRWLRYPLPRPSLRTRTALITAASGLNELLVTRTEGHEKEHAPIDIKKELWVMQPAASHSGLPKMMSRLNGEKQAPT
jgi:hypothetical protein